MVPFKITRFRHQFFLLILDLMSFQCAPSRSTNADVDVQDHDGGQPSNTYGTECPPGWTRYERTKSCFYVIERQMRWLEAERECIKLGGHLASITDEYENIFAFNVAKQANLTVPTLWLGRLVKLTRTGDHEWNDGAVGRHADGFRGEPPSGTDLCLTMWLDFDRPEGSWNEWDCNYTSGYSALCKCPFKKTSSATTAKPMDRFGIDQGLMYHSRRCCLVSSLCHNESLQCTPEERCIPDDLDCWTKTCPGGGIGWCLPLPMAQSIP